MNPTDQKAADGGEEYTDAERAILTPPTDDGPAETRESESQFAEAEQPSQVPSDDQSQSEPQGEADKQEAEPDQGRSLYENAREALRAEREARKRDQERFDQLLDMLRQQQAGQQPKEAEPEQPAEEIPGQFDPEKDDIFEWSQKAGKFIERMAEWRQQQEHQAQQQAMLQRQQQVVNQFMSELGQAEEAVAKEAPDYYDRVDNYVSWQAQTIAAIEGAPVQVVEQRVRQGLVRKAAELYDQGMNPAQYFYQVFANFAPQASEQGEAAPDQQAPADNGKQSPQEAFQSLGTVSGGSQKRRAKDVSSMSDAEYEAFLESGEFAKQFGLG